MGRRHGQDRELTVRRGSGRCPLALAGEKERGTGVTNKWDPPISEKKEEEDLAGRYGPLGGPAQKMMSGGGVGGSRAEGPKQRTREGGVNGSR
jgi:hypothetical protein